MKPSTSLCAGLLALFATPAWAIEFDPPAPHECEAVTLTVTRVFSSDCNWRFESSIQRSGQSIEVEIQPEGDPICLTVLSNESVSVGLGTLAAGSYEVVVRWSDDPKLSESATLEVRAGGCEGEPGFIRGDANADGKAQLPDAIAILTHTFLGETIPCREAADVTADGQLSIADPLGLLMHIFLGGAPPAAPFPDCAPPEAWSELGCATPQCRVGGGGESIWMAQAEGCMQCEPCDAMTLEGLVQILEVKGFTILEYKWGAVPVCQACTVCSTGRFYLVRIPIEERELLEAEGWGPAELISLR